MQGQYRGARSGTCCPTLFEAWAVDLPGLPAAPLSHLEDQTSLSYESPLGLVPCLLERGCRQMGKEEGCTLEIQLRAQRVCSWRRLFMISVHHTGHSVLGALGPSVWHGTARQKPPPTHPASSPAASSPDRRGWQHVGALPREALGGPGMSSFCCSWYRN